MPLGLSTADLLMLVGIPAASDYLSSRRQAGAVSDATGAQIASNERAMRIQQDTQREVLAFMGQIYGDQVARQLPFYNSGVAALSKLNQGLGLDVAPSAPPQTFQPRPTSTLADLPSYQAPYNETTKRTGGPGVGDLALTGLSLATPWLAGLGGAATTAAGVGGGAAVGSYGASQGAALGSSVAGGGFGSSLASLAMNPMFWGPAGAAAAIAVPWLKSQAHWEANTAGKLFETPFREKYLAPLKQQVASGQVDPRQALADLDKNWSTYDTEIMKWAGNSSDKRLVSQQSIAGRDFGGDGPYGGRYGDPKPDSAAGEVAALRAQLQAQIAALPPEQISSPGLQGEPPPTANVTPGATVQPQGRPDISDFKGIEDYYRRRA